MANDPSIWQLYGQTLAGWADVASTSVLSLAGINTFSDLGSADIGRCNWSIYQLGNALPAPTGSYSPHGDWFGAYWLYLSYLLQAAPAPAATTPLSNRPAALPPAAPDFQRYRQLLMALRNPPSATLRAARTPSPASALAQAHQDLTQSLASTAPQVVGALNLCWLASQQDPTSLNMPVSIATGTARCPTFSLAQWAQAWKTWNAPPLLRASPARVLLTGATVPLAPIASGNLRAQPPGGWPAFIGLSIATPAQPALRGLASNASTAGTSVSLSMALAQFGSFALTPGGWFNPAFLDASHYSAPSDAPDFFSANGALGLLPSHALVGLGPQLTLRASNPTQAEQLADTVTRIGPFSVQASTTVQLPPDASGSSGQVDIHFDAQDSNVPVLLGVVSQPARPTTILSTDKQGGLR